MRTKKNKHIIRKNDSVNVRNVQFPLFAGGLGWGLLLLFLSFYCFGVNAHSGKARFHILIDVDGAADDLRTICMLSGNREVEVLAVTASDGALTPAEAAMKTMALLHRFHHEGIPVGVGRAIGIKAPAWRRQSELIDWGDTRNITVPKISAKDLIVQTLEEEDEKVIFVCLGSLTNLNDALIARPKLKECIDKVIWYNNSATPLKGTNYDADRASADKVLTSGITIDIISENETHAIAIDEQYLNMIAPTGNVYVKQIVDTHRSDVLKSVVASKHLKAWDDLTAVYLFAPELFTAVKTGPAVTAYSLADDKAAEVAKNTIVRIFKGKPDTESRVFYGFPEDPVLYAADIAPVMKDIIVRHGHSEWRAGVLTNELHGHLGIYAIIGVKMGIRAREYFNIGVDDVTVTTFAGSRPPISCMNDGLQVSTGGTVGHGLITVITGEPIRPEATFTFKNKTLRMKLKPLYAAQIRRDVEEGIRLHGNLTEAYWLYIRGLAIKYWQGFDRHELFEMSK